MGSNTGGQCNFPALDEGLMYCQVAAGGEHTVLLRSDGAAVACGDNVDGQCALPDPEPDLRYVIRLMPTLVLQAAYDGATLRFVSLGGKELYQIPAAPADRLSIVHAQLTIAFRLGRLGLGFSKVNVVLTGGELLGDVSTERTSASLLGGTPCNSEPPRPKQARTSL